ncbi:MAG: SDR family NAD(P)-dependent oxidoreductase [Bacillota bacterium]
MKDKIVFITGGASGIGRAAAVLFAKKEAAAVIISDINDFKLADTGREIAGYGTETFTLNMDVGNPQRVNECFQEVLNKYGRIDVLVNCAGICKTTPFNEITPEEWNEMMRVNLLGTFLCCQRAVESMAAAGIKGSIVNVSSIAGKVGGLAAGAHYSASKAGVSCLTLSAARYAAKFGIRVNAVAPGPIDNDMTRDWPEEAKARLCSATPLGRFGASEEVAEAIIFLAGSGASHITGEILDVNGGAFMD